MRGKGAYDDLDNHLIPLYLNKSFDQLTFIELKKLPYFEEDAELIRVRETYSRRRLRYRTKYVARSVDAKQREELLFPKALTKKEIVPLWTPPTQLNKVNMVSTICV